MPDKRRNITVGISWEELQHLINDNNLHNIDSESFEISGKNSYSAQNSH